MSFLSDHTIKGCVQVGRIKIEPYTEANVQPASYDMTLDRFFKTPIYDSSVDPRHEMRYRDVEVPEDGVFVVPPLGFCLASTVERITLSTDLIGRLEGKSSVGRLGLTAHVTAGFFDPGFDGHATLELFNANNRPFNLYPGMKICQMSFARLTTHAARPYGHSDLGSKYQHQDRGPKGSQYHRNFEE